MPGGSMEDEAVGCYPLGTVICAIKAYDPS
jgi:hypothetical protein